MEFRKKNHFSGRMRHRFGSDSAIRVGHDLGVARGDVYHFLLRISWPAFLGIVVAVYLAIASAFAGAFLLGGHDIAHARSGSFLDAFFYSVDIISTLGYRSTWPLTLYAKCVGVMASLVGLLQVAFLTGLAYARFSKPNARMMYSNEAVITPVEGVPTLMFRVANQRRNLILEAHARVAVVQSVTTQEGRHMRRLQDLKLQRRESPMFNLSWTIMHPIDADSPFYNTTPEELVEKGTEIVVILTGTDEVLSRTVYSRHSYLVHEIKWGMHFADIISYTDDGQVIVDYTCFNNIQPDIDLADAPSGDA